MFGPAADSLLAYQTLKIVNLKDHRLGLLYYFLIFMICLFVFGYEVLYCNNHFDKRDVSGTPRLMLRQPTMNNCAPKERTCRSNYTSLLDLPYCSVYRGNSTQTRPEGRKPCVFADRYSMLPNGVTGGQMLIPTRITTTTQTRACTPGPANGYTCNNEYDILAEEESYVADIERYSVLISHSYRRDTMSGNNNRVLGYYLECQVSDAEKRKQRFERTFFGASECMGTVKRQPIECLKDDCNFMDPSEVEARMVVQPREAFQLGPSRRQDMPLPSAVAMVDQTISVQADPVPERRSGKNRIRASGSRRGSAAALNVEAAGAQVRWLDTYLEDDVFAMPEGDVFTVEKLLQLAGVDNLDNATNLDGEPLRSAGTVINVDVHYSNLEPFKSTFGGGEVTYEYHISLKPLHKVHDDQVRWAPFGAGSRIVERRHGVLIVVNVGGHFGFGSVVNTLLMLAEAASMLAVATILTDKIAIYFMERAEVYYVSKYEEPKIDDDDDA